MKLNQTTYRLWLRTDINQTGYTPAPAAINAAIAALVANIIPDTVNNPYDHQD
jgi:hypothetical protein